jgi:glucose-1-phosphate cytidylyltransferase
VVSLGDGHVVADIGTISDSALRINGGYFAFKREIFDLLGDGEELVGEPFRRLMAQRQLMAYAYDGFWQSMDTFKDRQQLDELYAAGHAPWELWRRNGNGNGKR